MKGIDIHLPLIAAIVFVLLLIWYIATSGGEALNKMMPGSGNALISGGSLAFAIGILIVFIVIILFVLNWRNNT